MESWLDTSLIDLSQYHPRMLGKTDDAALKGLLSRMDELIAFSAIRGKQAPGPGPASASGRPAYRPSGVSAGQPSFAWATGSARRWR